MGERPEIPEFYADKSIFITGCSGFIGKVLLWKLLYSCPKIKKIYILLRPKGGSTIQERKELLLQSPIFNSFKSDNPKVLEKVEVIAGDVAEGNLGLSDFSIQLLLNEVSIVFYGAALIKLDASLKESINVNTKGLLRALDIALEMKQLKTFIYISTAYCCADVKNIDEKLYSMNSNPNHILKIIDWMPKPILDKITPDIIAPLTTTYTFSKRLAESLLVKYENKLPLVIARPTIVNVSWKEPMPGWVDSLSGFVGMTSAVGTGLLHSICISRDAKGDLIPVDIVCNRLVAIPWVEHKKNRSSEIIVYNLALADIEQMKWSDYTKMTVGAFFKYPFKNILWYPTVDIIKTNSLKHQIDVLIYQLVPAYIIDFLLRLFNQKTFLVKVQRKIIQGEKLMSYFGSRDWNFETKNVKKMKEMMNESDRSIFPVTEKEIDIQLFFENEILGIRKYILQEKFDDPSGNRIRMKLFLALKVFVKVALYYCCFKLLLILVRKIIKLS